MYTIILCQGYCGMLPWCNIRLDLFCCQLDIITWIEIQATPNDRTNLPKLPAAISTLTIC